MTLIIPPSREYPLSLPAETEPQIESLLELTNTDFIAEKIKALNPNSILSKWLNTQSDPDTCLKALKAVKKQLGLQSLFSEKIDDKWNLVHIVCALGQDTLFFKIEGKAGSDDLKVGATGFAVSHIAAFFGRTSILNGLIEKPSFTLSKGYGLNELEWAILGGHIEAVKTLLKVRSIPYKNAKGITPFQLVLYSAKIGRVPNPLDLFKMIWNHTYQEDAGAESYKARLLPKENGPLTLAAISGQKEIVTYLLDWLGGHLDIQSMELIPPAFYQAANYNQSKIVKLFLDYRFKPDAGHEEYNQTIQALDGNSKIRRWITEAAKGNYLTSYQPPNPKKQEYETVVYKGGGAKGIFYPDADEAFRLSCEERSKAQNNPRLLASSIKRYAGTSAGSIFALFKASGMSYEQLTTAMQVDFSPFLGEQAALAAENGTKKDVFLTFLKQLGLKFDTTLKLIQEAPQQGILRTSAAALLRGKSLFQEIQHAITTLQQQWSSFRGLNDGKKLMEWILKTAQVQIPWLNENTTLGEWKTKVEEENSLIKHLYIAVTNLNTGEPQLFSTESSEDKDYCLLSLIRASLSIPLVFTPVKLKSITPHGQQFSQDDYVDGGLLANHLIAAFDTKKYTSQDAPGREDFRTFNKTTIGFAFKTSPVTRPPAENVLDHILHFASLYYQTEETLSAFYDLDYHRTVEIDPGKIGTLSFKQFSSTELQNIQLSSFRGVQEYFDIPVTAVKKKVANPAVSPPLTPEIIVSPQQKALKEFIQKLEATYKRESRITYIHSTEKDEDVCDSFINLAILTQKQVKEAEDPRKQQAENSQLINNRDLYYNSFEALYESKENIDLKKIFSPLKNEPACTRIIVEGRAGIGKTTLCKYIANAWLDPKKRASLLGWGDQFTVVIWIKLRELNSEAQNLYEAIALLYKLETEETLKKGRKTSHIPQVASDVEALLKPLEDAGKVLYLIDGYDEIADQISSYRHLTEALRSKPNWILTTRPHQFTIRYDEKARQLEILGFTDDNITAYTDRFFEVFKDEPYSQQGKLTLTHLLATQPNARCLTRIPINLEILCSMFLDKEIATSPLQTLTSLYEGMLLDILRRYVRDKTKKTPSGSFEGVIAQLRFKEKEILYLEELAFKAMEAKSLIFHPIKTLPEGVSPDDEAAFLQEVFNLGFTKRTKENPNKFKEEHYFFHLTVQEFFAARYLAHSILADANEWIEFIRQNKFNNRFSIVFRFTAGLLVPHPNKLDDFLKAIIEEPSSALRLHEFVLAARCLDETPITRCSTVQKQIVDFIVKEIRSTYNDSYRNSNDNLSVLVNRMHYIYEQGVVDFLIKPAKQGNLIAIWWIGNLKIQRPKFINALVQDLQHSNHGVSGSAASALGKIKSQDPAVIEALVQLLQHPDAYARRIATYALEEIKPQDPAALQALVQLLQHRNEDIRSRAADALGEIKSQDPAVLQALVLALQDPGADVRSRAADALEKIKPQDPAVLQAIVQLLQHPDAYVRVSAAYVLGEIKPQDPAVLQALVLALQDPGADVSSRAVSALEKIKPQDPAVLQGLVQLLQDPDKYVRRRAADALGRIKPQDPAVLQGLVQLLQDLDEDVRRSADYVLGKIKPQDPAVLQGLVQLLQDPDYGVRRSAAYALEKIKPQDPAVLQGLVQLLQDPDYGVRSSAAYVLGEIKPQDPAVLQGLVQLLQDPDEDVRRIAADALGKIKPQDPAALQTLVQLLQDPDEDVRRSAAYALGKIKPQDPAALQALVQALQALVQALQDPDEFVRISAADALGKIKPQDPAVLQGLVQLLQDPDEDVRRRAAYALGEIKPQDPATLQVLVQALQDPDEFVRSSAADALGKIKPQDPATLQALVQALQDPNENVRWRAAYALRKIKPQDPATLQALMQALQDPDEGARRRAAYALGKIKPQDPAVLQALVRALQDPDEGVRGSAASAIEKIKPQDPLYFGSIIELFSKTSDQSDQNNLMRILLELPIYSSLFKLPAGHEKVFATLIYLQRKLCVIHTSSIEIEEEGSLQSAIKVGEESANCLKQYLEELNSNPEHFIKNFSSQASKIDMETPDDYSGWGWLDCPPDFDTCAFNETVSC